MMTCIDRGECVAGISPSKSRPSQTESTSSMKTMVLTECIITIKCVMFLGVCAVGEVLQILKYTCIYRHDSCIIYNCTTSHRKKGYTKLDTSGCDNILSTRNTCV